MLTISKIIKDWYSYFEGDITQFVLMSILAIVLTADIVLGILVFGRWLIRLI